MNEVTIFIDWVQNIGFVGLLIVLAIPKLRQSIFGLNGYDIMKDEINKVSQALIDHMKKEEEEMDDIRDKISTIQKDVAFIKGKLEK